MNLVKRLFRGNSDHGRGTALTQREGGGLLRRKNAAGFDGVEQLWNEIDRDPWSLVRDPWSTLDRMRERVSTLAQWPAVDVSEDDNAVTVRCDVPGVEANDLNVEVSGNLLTVSGSRNDEWSGKRHGVRRQERVSGSFSRTITLPEYVDPAKLDARYEKGTLTITAAKLPGKSPRRVTVQAA